MSDINVKPLRSFEYGGKIRVAGSAPFVVPARVFKELEARGLVKEHKEPKAKESDDSKDSDDQKQSRSKRKNNDQ